MIDPDVIAQRIIDRYRREVPGWRQAEDALQHLRLVIIAELNNAQRRTIK